MSFSEMDEMAGRGEDRGKGAGLMKISFFDYGCRGNRRASSTASFSKTNFRSRSLVTIVYFPPYLERHYVIRVPLVVDADQGHGSPPLCQNMS